MNAPEPKHPRASETLIARLALKLHEIMFSSNIASALVFALLIYISSNEAFENRENDSSYYFLRSACRINDILHIRSIRPVSTSAVAREIPSRLSRTGEELLIALTLFGLASLIFLLVRLIGRPARRALYNWAAGVTALFAMPACFLVVLKLAWHWPSSQIATVPLGFWRSPLVGIFIGEIVGLVILAAIERYQTISLSTLGVLFFLHYAFWTIAFFGIGISIHGIITPYVLVCVSPIAGIAWLLHLQDRRSDALAAFAPFWTGPWMFVPILAVLLLVLAWLPGPHKDLASSGNIESATIQMSRGPCFGSCPSYAITIHGNGVVEYIGKLHVKVRERQTAAISREQIVAILSTLDRAHFSSLEDRAFNWCFDTGSVEVSVSLDGKTKRVVSDDWCAGAKSGVQANFVRAAADIDTIVKSAQWVNCDGPCFQR